VHKRKNKAHQLHASKSDIHKKEISVARTKEIRSQDHVFTVREQVVDEPVVIIHTILVDPPNSTCIVLPKKQKHVTAVKTL
jgi:hypothetical protein